ncbi:M14 family zinc carboxypeptidase [Streptomyces nanshensis]|uniref:M14 family zinc carboxypeptidase n=1 Tax=Streptomyces nanshensis TaxID=518642 RepID=UPI00085C782D|nr:M14 family zinc carboxypeptidase [Streptomyces nanshensis]
MPHFPAPLPHAERLLNGPTPDEDLAASRTVAAARRHLAYLTARAGGHLTEAGTSRGGRTLELGVIGNGQRQILVIGGPHPNEPVGAATVLSLAGLLARDPALRETATWHLLPFLDPDGAARNELWTAASLSPDFTSYHRGFFRPARAQQPEMALPRSGPADLPETETLAALLTGLRPDVMCSLHNADLGGTFLLTSHPAPALPALLHEAAARHKVPVEPAPADAALDEWERLDDGVYRMPPPAPTARRLHSVQLARELGTFALLPEVPAWTGTSGTLTPQDAAARLEEACTALKPYADRCTPGTSPYADAVLDTLNVLHAIRTAWSRSPAPATGSTRDCAHLLPLRTAGMLAQELSHQHRIHPRDAELAADVREMHSLLQTWCDEAEQILRPRPVPLRTAVALQLDLALGAATLGPAPATT